MVLSVRGFCKTYTARNLPVKDNVTTQLSLERKKPQLDPTFIVDSYDLVQLWWKRLFKNIPLKYFIFKTKLPHSCRHEMFCKVTLHLSSQFRSNKNMLEIINRKCGSSDDCSICICGGLKAISVCPFIFLLIWVSWCYICTVEYQIISVSQQLGWSKLNNAILVLRTVAYWFYIFFFRTVFSNRIIFSI